MIIDTLANSARYYSLHHHIKTAFDYLLQTDLTTLPAGRHIIDGDNIFAIVQEYNTLDAATEQMESHKKYIDVQYMINGAEQVGHALHTNQSVSKPYNAEEDYMLYSSPPSFFTTLAAGTFMVFFPTDLHMPCIMIDEPSKVKKVVVKILAE